MDGELQMKSDSYFRSALVAAVAAWAGAATIAFAVDYYDPVGGTNATCAACNAYTDQTTLASGWYVVSGVVTNSIRIKVSGDVNLILVDGAELAATKGINVAVKGTVTNSLTIWAHLLRQIQSLHVA